MCGHAVRAAAQCQVPGARCQVAVFGMRVTQAVLAMVRDAAILRPAGGFMCNDKRPCAALPSDSRINPRVQKFNERRAKTGTSTKIISL